MMKFSTFTLFIFFIFSNLVAQDGSLEWIFLDSGTNTGNCNSATDCNNDIVCFGVQYTPAIDGGMTSYTLSYSGNCDGNGIGLISNSSCVLTDNSQLNDACAGSSLFQLFTSASGGGTIPLTANTPIILHQVCFDVSTVGSVMVNPDAFSPEPYTVSLNLPGGGFATDTPTFNGFTVDNSDCSSTLPVEWQSFHVEKQRQDAQLEWVTSAEVNHDYFAVEWSTDGRIFNAISEVYHPDMTNERNEKTYRFLHANPGRGLHYYRIRQYDYDGTSSLSQLRLLDFSASSNNTVNLFPNPTEGIIYAALGSPSNEAGNATIYDSTGRLALSLNIPTGTTVIPIDLTRLPQGMYLLHYGDSMQRLFKN